MAPAHPPTRVSRVSTRRFWLTLPPKTVAPTSRHNTEWASQPYVVYAALTWIVTFCVVVTIILGLGFGPAGVVAGSIAAGFQAAMYGGFTPAGGIFATLTSRGMSGMLMPAAVIAAIVLATGVAVVVGVCGVGR